MLSMELIELSLYLSVTQKRPSIYVPGPIYGAPGSKPGFRPPPDPKMIGDKEQWFAHQCRPITREQLLTGRWAKVNNHGIHLLVAFRPDGTLHERQLFNPNEQWYGSWELVSPKMLKLSVSHYQLYVVSPQDDGIYHGIEVSSQEEGRRLYFNLFHVDP